MADKVSQASDGTRRDRPAILTGLVSYVEAPTAKQLLLNQLRNVYANAKNVALPLTHRPPITRGFNIALYDADDQSLLEDIGALPNYFPGEDIAIRDVVLEHDGEAISTLAVHSLVRSCGDRYPSFSAAARRLLKGSAVQADLYHNVPTGPAGRLIYLSPGHLR